MSSIALYDWDLIQWEQPIVFNLELMKMINYYRYKRHITKMLPEFNSSRYSKIILRKDYNDDFYPPEIFMNKKVEYGGLAFTNGIYSPLPDDIENMQPDPSIYSEMGKYYQLNESTKAFFASQLRSIHLRLSLDGENINPEVERQFNFHKKSSFNKTIVLHDPNITAIKSSYDFIQKEILTRYPKGIIGNKYSIKVSSIEEFENWFKMPKKQMINTIMVNSILPDEVLIGLDRALYSGQHIIYNLDSIDDKQLVNVFLQAKFFVDNKARFSLNITDKKKISPVLDKYLTLFNAYIEYYPKYQYECGLTFFWYAKKKSNWLKEDLIELFEYFRENNYALFRLFYECIKTKVEDNKIKSNWRSNRAGG